MIEMNELRLGNLVNEKVLGDCLVDSISGISAWIAAKHLNKDRVLSDVVYHINDSELFPIPVTPEILQKLGFEKYEWMNGWFIKFLGRHLMIQFYHDTILVFITRVSKDSLGQKIDGRYSFLGDKSPETLKYVHQLQNIHYSLTGQELIYNH